jgi:hypothetical protein
MPKNFRAKIEIYQGKRLINKYDMIVYNMKIEDGINKHLKIEVDGADISEQIKSKKK